MTLRIFEPDYIRNQEPNDNSSLQSESTRSGILLSDFSSYSDLSVLGFSSLETLNSVQKYWLHELQPPEEPQPPRGVKRPEEPQPPRGVKRPGEPQPSRNSHFFHRNIGFRHNRPNLRPSNSKSCLIQVPITSTDETPGPSGERSNDFRPPANKKLKVNESQKKNLEMAVRHASPNCKLSQRQGKFIQSQLVEAIDNTPREKPLPCFVKSFFEQGIFWVVCANEESKQWLIENVMMLDNLHKDLNLVVEAVKFPKRPVVYVDLPEVENTLEVLARLANQNRDLRTEGWVALSRKLLFKSKQRITFSIDTSSFEFLKSINFRLNWKLQTVVIRVPFKARREKGAQGVKTSTLTF